MSYKFPLQKVLDLKQTEKERARQAYAETLTELTDAEQKLEGLLNERNRVESLISDQTSGTLSILEIRNLYAYINSVDSLISDQVRSNEEIGRRLHTLQEVLSAKTTEEKTWTSLRDRKKSEYEIELLQKEQKFLDDLASSRYRRALSTF